MDVAASLEKLLSLHKNLSCQVIADSLLQEAFSLDQTRPADDISVIVVNVSERTGDEVRRMTVRLPLG
jgi:hypothetical protein